MIKFRKYFLIVVGVILYGCNSSGDNDGYFPDPNKGDFVMITSMDHKVYVDDLEQQNIKFSVEYNAELNPLSIEVVNSGEKSIYDFTYTEKHVLSSIALRNQPGIPGNLAKWRAQYTGDVLSAWLSENSSESVHYTYEGKKVVGSQKGNLSFAYTWDGERSLMKATNVDTNVSMTFNYTGGYKNPFIYTKMNLFNALFDETALLSLTLASEAAIDFIDFGRYRIDYTYQVDEFGYINKMIGSRDGKIVSETSFISKIFRLQEK